MNGLVNIYKPICLTPYQVVKDFRDKIGLAEITKVGYAGRLDPLASGVILLMIGQTCKDRDRHQLHNKTYEFDLIFGIQTDSLDPLGIVKIFDQKKIDKTTLTKALSRFKGKVIQRYPLYSSYAINGTPMYKLAREGKLLETTRPEKTVNIDSCELVSLNTIHLDEYAADIIERVRRIKGKFRQNMVIRNWRKIATNYSDQIQIAKIITSVASGTYIRSLAEDIAEDLGTYGIADNIVRTNVGEYSIEDSLRI